MTNVTATKSANKAQKPSKPHPDFPLFAHATGRWAKKVRGKMRYFGRWDDPQGSLEKWLAQKDILLAGEEPPETDTQAFLVKDLVNRFLTSKLNLRDAGEITNRSFNDYQRTGKRMARILGTSKRLDCLKVSDFEGLRAELAKTLGPVSLKNELTRVRVCLKYGFDAELIEKPLRYEKALAPPKMKTLRKAKREAKASGRLMHFTQAECKTILGGIRGQFRAMFLLGLNCGYNGAECGQLEFSDIDLVGGWIDTARRKSEVDRRCKLWPETIAAINEWLDVRPEPKPGCEDLVFLTEHGRNWHKDSTASPLSREFRNAITAIDPALYIKGRSFKGLRHSFCTVADSAIDPPAIKLVMGHSDGNDMTANYRQAIGDERLERVASHVHSWLFD